MYLLKVNHSKLRVPASAMFDYGEQSGRAETDSDDERTVSTVGVLVLKSRKPKGMAFVPTQPKAILSATSLAFVTRIGYFSPLNSYDERRPAT